MAGELVALEQPGGEVLTLLHRELEHGLSVLLDEVEPPLDRLVGGREPASAGRHAQRLAERAVHLVEEIEERGLARRCG